MSTCNYDPRLDVNKPLGMFHCPLCGEMVVAGFPHPVEQDPPQSQDVDPVGVRAAGGESNNNER